MTTRGNALESLVLVESGVRQPGNVVVDIAEMQQFQNSNLQDNNTSVQHLSRLQIVDELAKKPVCEDSFCIGDVRHVDVYSTANFAQNQFELLDKDGNGYIKDDEIKAYAETFKAHMTANMKGHLDALRSNYDSTMALANDEWGAENDGITRQDLKVLENREDGVRAREYINGFVSKVFDEADTNSNGLITADEIKAYERTFGFKMEHPVREREALKIVGHLAEDRNYARATGDFWGMTDYQNSGQGLTRAQVSHVAEMVKNGVDGFTNPFFFFDKK